MIKWCPGEYIPMIRTPTPDDAADLVPLFAALAHPAEATQLKVRLGRLLSDPEYSAWVAEGEAELLGFAAGHLLFPVEQDRPAAQLIALVTAEQARSRGIGSDLCATFESWAVARGATRAILTSGVQRHEAHEFYRRRGYATTGLRFGKSI